MALTNAKRLKRLEELAYIMENHDEVFPKIKFDISNWADKEYADEHNSTAKEELNCVYAACALGSAACYPPFIKEGLKLAGTTPICNGSSAMGSGEEFFGISRGESEWLFDPDAYREKAIESHQEYFGGYDYDKLKATDVAKRVRYLIEHYKRYPKQHMLSYGLSISELPYHLKVVGAL